MADSERDITVVVVDDYADSRALLAMYLRTEGFQVKEAATGMEALEVAATQPSLMILDINLPDIDGFEVVARVAEMEDAPPVVLTSTRSAADFGGLISRSGARAFVSKSEISGAALAAFVGLRGS